MLSAFVLAYITSEKQLDLTRECVASLVGKVDELVYVDNGSTMEYLMPPGADKYVTINTNIGYIGGVNKGISECSGDYITLVTNDTKVIDGDLHDLCIPDAIVFPKMVTPENYKHPFYHGCFYVMPNQPWIKHSNDYEFFFSDTEVFMRGMERGKAMVYKPSVTILHHVWQTLEKGKKRTATYENDKAIFIKKFGFDPDLEDILGR